MKTIRHMCVDIRGVLRWKDRDLKGMFTDDNGRTMSADEIRNELYDELAKGRRVLPMSKECVGFDYQTGCPGHPVEDDGPDMTEIRS